MDGEETSYFEWLGAGTLEIRGVAGAMHQTNRRAALLTLIQFGFDHERLYVRLDARRRLADVLAEGYECSLRVHPAGGDAPVRPGSEDGAACRYFLKRAGGGRRDGMVGWPSPAVRSPRPGASWSSPCRWTSWGLPPATAWRFSSP